LKQKKVAIIDLGSNSIRILIMKVYEDGAYKIADQGKEMVRLSENMGSEMTLKPEPIERTIYTLSLFKKIISSHNVDYVFPVATAALRNAKNRVEVLTKIKEETGFDFYVATGEDEAFFDYLGVVNTIDIKDCLIIDIGGGSTELAWVENWELKEAISLPYGAVILTEKFIGKGKCTVEKAEKIRRFMIEQLENIKWLNEVKKLPLVGLGGSIRALAKIDRKRIGFPLKNLHNYQMSSKEVNQAYERVLNAEDEEERKKIPGVGRDRADIIVGGLTPVKALMDYMKTDKLIISGNGLREGVFFKHYLDDLSSGNNRVKDVLFHSVNNILLNYEVNISHSTHVQSLALTIFDQTRNLHKMGDDERMLLSVSALLHDIGLYVDYYNHQNHGFYLVLNSRINGLRNRELVMCAFIVGMHRNMEFKTDWKSYNMLIHKDDYKTIRQLGLFLRIAEMLDRDESGSVESIICQLDRKQLELELRACNSVELGIASAMKSEKEFENLFRRKLKIKEANIN